MVWQVARLTGVSGKSTFVLRITRYESTMPLTVLTVVNALPGLVMLRKKLKVPSGYCAVSV